MMLSPSPYHGSQIKIRNENQLPSGPSGHLKPSEKEKITKLAKDLENLVDQHNNLNFLNERNRRLIMKKRGLPLTKNTQSSTVQTGEPFPRFFTPPPGEYIMPTSSPFAMQPRIGPMPSYSPSYQHISPHQLPMVMRNFQRTPEIFQQPQQILVRERRPSPFGDFVDYQAYLKDYPEPNKETDFWDIQTDTVEYWQLEDIAQALPPQSVLDHRLTPSPVLDDV